MADVNIVMQAQSQSAVQQINLSVQSMNKLTQAMQRAGSTGGQAGRRTASSWAFAGQNIGQAASALLGVGTPLTAMLTTVGLLRREFEEIVRIGQRSAQFQLQRGSAIFKAIAAFTPEPGFGVDDFVERLKSGAKEAGISQVALADAAEKIFAAGGVSTREEALETAITASKFDPSAAIAGDVDVIAQKGIAARTVVDVAGVSREVGVAFAQKAFTAAFTQNQQQFAQFVIPGAATLLKATTRDLTVEERREEFRKAVGLVAAITQEARDPSGRISTNAAIRIAVNAAEIATQAGFRGSPSEVFDFIAADPRLRRRFLGALGLRDVPVERLKQEAALAGEGEAGGEARIKPIIAQRFLPGENELKRQLRVAEERAGEIDQSAVRDVLERTRALKARQETLVATLEQNRRSVEQDVLGDTPLGTTEKLVQSIDAALVGARRTLIERNVRGLALRGQLAGEDELQQIAIAIQQARVLRSQQLQGKGSLVESAFGVFSSPTQFDIEAAERFTELIERWTAALSDRGLRFDLQPTSSGPVPRAVPITIEGDSRPQAPPPARAEVEELEEWPPER